MVKRILLLSGVAFTVALLAAGRALWRDLEASGLFADS